MVTTYGHNKARWNSLVKRGKTLVGHQRENQWAIADLILAVTPVEMFPTGIHSEFTVKDALRAFAREIDLDMKLGALLEYRANAIAWPPGKRCLGASWSAHRALGPHPDRFNLMRPGLTHKQATELAGRKKWTPPSNKLTAEPEEIRSIIAWANRLLRRAETLTANSVLNYKERAKFHELVDTTEFRVENLRRAVRQAENKFGKRAA